MDGGDHPSVVASARLRAGRWRWISAPCGDRTQCLERLVSRGKPRIGGCLEQRLTQLVDGPPEVQRAAQVRLELLVVPGGGEHRHHHQAAVLQLETGPVPDATPDVRSEEHTSELQSRPHLVCRLLLEKKKKL